MIVGALMTPRNSVPGIWNGENPIATTLASGFTRSEEKGKILPSGIFLTLKSNTSLSVSLKRSSRG
jgi:hypothetical protein